MSVRLSHRQASRVEAAQRTLLSPLEYPSIAGWCDAAMRALSDLFETDRAMFFLPCSSTPHFAVRAIDPEIREPYEAALIGTEAGRNRYADPALDRAMARLAAVRLNVWNTPVAEQVSGVPKEEMPFYHDVLRPGGLAHMAMMGAGLSTGQAILGVFHSQEDRDLFGEDALGVLRLLLPAFDAGVRTAVGLQVRRAELASALDPLAQALLICDGDGRELHRNHVLEWTLAGDPERETVLAAMRSLARATCRLREPTRKTDAPRPRASGSKQVKTSKAQYRIRGAFLSPGTFGRGPAVLLVLDGSDPTLPDTAALRERFGLTAREAEVALLLAQGWTNQRIAVRLSVSVHTARHHAQHVLEKLGLHSRKALALKLLTPRDRSS